MMVSENESDADFKVLNSVRSRADFEMSILEAENRLGFWFFQNYPPGLTATPKWKRNYECNIKNTI